MSAWTDEEFTKLYGRAPKGSERAVALGYARWRTGANSADEAEPHIQGQFEVCLSNGLLMAPSILAALAEYEDTTEGAREAVQEVIGLADSLNDMLNASRPDPPPTNG